MQTNDPRHFSSLGPSENNHENRRDAEGRSLSLAGKIGSDPFHCSRTAHSMQALTIKIERVNRRRRDPSSVSVVDRNSRRTSRLDSGGQESDERQQTLHTSPFQLPLQPACSCLCCKNPEKSGTGLSGESKRSESSQLGPVSPQSQSITPRTGPPHWMQGRHGVGGTRLGFGKRGLG